MNVESDLQIDWAQAPEGATHRSGLNGLWYKFDFQANTAYFCTDHRREWKDASPATDYMVEGSVAGMIAREDGPEEAWSASADEGWNNDSLGELIDNSNGELEVGQEVYVGERRYPDPASFIDAERVRLEIEEHMGDNSHANGFAEVCDGYPKVSDDAKAELESFLSAWARKHCQPRFYGVENVKPYTLTAEDVRVA